MAPLQIKHERASIGVELSTTQANGPGLRPDTRRHLALAPGHREAKRRLLAALRFVFGSPYFATNPSRGRAGVGYPQYCLLVLFAAGRRGHCSPPGGRGLAIGGPLSTGSRASLSRTQAPALVAAHSNNCRALPKGSPGDCCAAPGHTMRGRGQGTHRATGSPITPHPSGDGGDHHAPSLAALPALESARPRRQCLSPTLANSPSAWLPVPHVALKHDWKGRQVRPRRPRRVAAPSGRQCIRIGPSGLAWGTTWPIPRA